MDDQYFTQLAMVESSNNPLAKNPKSSAKGRFQFIDETAKQYGINAPFGTPEYQRQEKDAVKRLTKDNYNHLKNVLGRSPTNGELYLAHQQGAGGAEKILTSSDAKAIEVLGQDEVLNNGGDENMTAGQFATRWTSKFDDIDAQKMGIAPESTKSNEENTPQLPEFNLYDVLNNKTGELVNASNENKEFNLYDLLNEEPENNDEFVTTNDLSQKRIDKDSGAPSYVRAIVGGVQKPQDRLTTIQKYFPDAQAYGEDNFIYTDPESGNVTLYNPKGLDWGDTASIAREGVITVGSGLGATAGFFAGGIGAPVGAGVGAGVSANGFDALMNRAGLTADTRTFTETLMGTTVEAGAAMTGEVAGPLIAKGGKALIGGGKETLQRTVALFDRLGVKPTLATTGGKGSARMQAGLVQNQFTTDKIVKVAQEQLEQVHKATNEVIGKFGQGKSIQGLGGDVVDAAENVATRFKSRQAEIYDDVFSSIDASVKFPVKNIQTLRNEISDRVARAPKSLSPIYKEMQDELDAIIADAGSDGIPFDALREIRTQIGKRMNQPSLVESGAVRQTQFDMMYANLTLDISEAAASVGDDVARQLKVADRYTKTFLKNSTSLLEKINRLDADEKVGKFLLNSSRDGGTSLSLLRRNFTDDEWDVVAASALRRLGNPMKDGEFSVAQFLNNYEKIAPEAKKALFGGKRYAGARQALDELVEGLTRLGDVERYANTSNTAGANYSLTLLDTIGGGAAGSIAGLVGDSGTAATVGLGTLATIQAGRVIAPKTAAKLLTSEKFVRWLAEPVKDSTINVTTHIAKLYAIAEANDELRDDIYEFADTLKENTDFSEQQDEVKK